MREIYLLNNDDYEGVNRLPVIKSVFFDKKIDLSLYDALVFTSKNGVRAIDRIDKNWREKDIYSIGRGTSKEIEKYNANLVYTAKSSYGDDFAKEIKQRLSSKRVLFPRAKVVTSKLNQILKDNGVLLDEIVVYETVCVNYTDDLAPKRDSVIIFTSPSTIECFFKNFEWRDDYIAVCIGKVTAKAMPDGIEYHLSENPNIPSCIEKAISFVKQN